MPAAAVGMEEVTITLESAVVKFCVMGIVVADKSYFELCKEKAFTLLGVALGLVNLTDHSRVHFFISFWENQKARKTKRAFQKTRRGGLPNTRISGYSDFSIVGNERKVN
jgi:hypothetical protein